MVVADIGHWVLTRGSVDVPCAHTGPGLLGVGSLHERSLRFWFISLGDDLQLRRVNDEHHAVLDAIAISHAATKPQPPPRTAPRTHAIVGLGIV